MGGANLSLDAVTRECEELRDLRGVFLMNSPPLNALSTCIFPTNTDDRAAPSQAPW